MTVTEKTDRFEDFQVKKEELSEQLKEYAQLKKDGFL